MLYFNQKVNVTNRKIIKWFDPSLKVVRKWHVVKFKYFYRNLFLTFHASEHIAVYFLSDTTCVKHASIRHPKSLTWGERETFI